MELTILFLTTSKWSSIYYQGKANCYIDHLYMYAQQCSYHTEWSRTSWLSSLSTRTTSARTGNGVERKWSCLRVCVNSQLLRHNHNLHYKSVLAMSCSVWVNYFSVYCNYVPLADSYPVFGTSVGSLVCCESSVSHWPLLVGSQFCILRSQGETAYGVCLASKRLLLYYQGVVNWVLSPDSFSHRLHRISCVDQLNYRFHWAHIFPSSISISLMLGRSEPLSSHSMTNVLQCQIFQLSISQLRCSPSCRQVF